MATLYDEAKLQAQNQEEQQQQHPVLSAIASLRKPVGPPNLYEQARSKQIRQQTPLLGRLGALGMGAAQTLANIPVTGAQELIRAVGHLEPEKYRQRMEQMTIPGFTFGEKAQVSRAFPGWEKAGGIPAAMAAPLGEVKGIGLGIGKAAEEAPGLIRAAARGIAKRVPELGATGTYYGTLLTQPGSKEDVMHRNAAIGAITSLFLGGVLGAIPGGVQLFIKNYANLAKMKAGMSLPAASKIVTPAEAHMIADTLKKQPIPLADITNSPKLQSLYHNILGSVPFSGIPARDAAIVNNVDQQAINLHNGLLNGAKPNTTNLRQMLTDEITNTAQNNKEQASQLYDSVYDRADAQNIPFDATIAREFAHNELRKDQMAKAAGYPDLLDDEQKAHLNAMAQIKKSKVASKRDTGAGVEAKYVERAQKKYGVNKIEPSFRTLSDILNAYDDIRMRSTGSKYKMYDELGKAYKADINNAINSHGTPDLKNGLEKADKNYADNVVPYYKKSSIYNILRNKINLNSPTLENTLVNTQHAKVLNDLSKPSKERLLRVMLDSEIPDDGKMAAPKVLNAINKLSDHEKKNLISPQLENRIKQLQVANKVATPAREAAKSNFFRQLHNTGRLAYYLGLPAAYVAHGGLSPLLSVLAGAPFVARGLGRLMRSPLLKQAYLKQQLPLEKLRGITRRAATRGLTKGLIE